MTACGTSYHSGLVGEYLFEELARMPVEVEYASEFRYRNPPIDRHTVMLAMLALYFGRTRHLSSLQGARIIEELRNLPETVRHTLGCHDQVKRVAAKYADARNVLYLGRQYLYPTALEGALKLKEISYIHAEGYPAAEMKHGPIALVDEQTPSVFLVPRGYAFDKVMSNMQEIKARGGPVIAVCSAGDAEVAAVADDVVEIPDAPEYLQPVVAAVPLQLLAYE